MDMNLIDAREAILIALIRSGLSEAEAVAFVEQYERDIITYAQ